MQFLNKAPVSAPEGGSSTRLLKGTAHQFNGRLFQAHLSLSLVVSQHIPLVLYFYIVYQTMVTTCCTDTNHLDANTIPTEASVGIWLDAVPGQDILPWLLLA